MKKLLIIVIAVLFILTGCGSKKEAIIGSWYGIKVVETENGVDYEYDPIEFNGVDYKLEFKEDNTVTFVEPENNYLIETTWEKDKDLYKFNLFGYNMKAKIVNKQLVISFPSNFDTDLVMTYVSKDVFDKYRLEHPKTDYQENYDFEPDSEYIDSEYYYGYIFLYDKSGIYSKVSDELDFEMEIGELNNRMYAEGYCYDLAGDNALFSTYVTIKDEDTLVFDDLQDDLDHWFLNNYLDSTFTVEYVYKDGNELVYITGDYVSIDDSNDKFKYKILAIPESVDWWINDNQEFIDQILK